MKVLLTGATGYIGKELGKKLVRAGHEVYALSRNAKSASLQLPYPAQVIEGDLANKSLDPSQIKHIEAVIHLAGENVGEGRWTPERKERIVKSRLNFTQNLIASLPVNLKVFISSSAIGIYGDRGDEMLTEKSSLGSGFLADVCKKWEGAVEEGKHKISKARTVIFRTGVVFSPFGGALMKMLPPFQMGVGGILAGGKQWMSWIHLQDLVQMYLAALESPQWEGVYNAVAPDAVTNAQFTRSLAEALRVNQGPPVPSFALRALYGEMASVILDSQRVQSERLQNMKFQFSTLKEALKNCAEPYQDGDQVFYAEQYFPMSKEKVFPFFAKAENLESITPPLLHFQVEKVSTASIEKGTLIDYQLKIHGLPIGWKTLIEEWEPGVKFVDTQLNGPYKKWHHTHTFEKLGEGTLMTDLVRYKLPVGKLGQLFGGSFVRGDVEKIFAYRHQVVPQLLERS